MVLFAINDCAEGSTDRVSSVNGGQAGVVDTRQAFLLTN